MYQSASVMVVPLEVLEDNSVPEAFKQYVERYFKQQNIFGKECMVAFQVISLSTPKDSQKGVAPAHAGAINLFKEGLPEGVSLYDWIEQNKGRIWQFWSTWDDGCSGGTVYED